MEVRCDGCKWWCSNAARPRVGKCYCGIPTIDGHGDGVWPITVDSNHCGQWLDKSEPYPWEMNNPCLSVPQICKHCKHWTEHNSTYGKCGYGIMLDNENTQCGFGCNRWVGK